MLPRIGYLAIVLMASLAQFAQAQQKDKTVFSVVVHPPWVIQRGDGQLEGIMINLIESLGRELNTTTEVKVTSGQYGRVENGNWNGVIGDVINGVADVGAGDIAITKERQGAVDFSKPFYTDYMTMVAKSGRIKDKFGGIKLLFTPLDLGNWIMLMVVCIVVSALYAAINHFSPSEWSKVSDADDKIGSKDSFNAKNASFFVHSTLNWQGYKDVPRSPAGRFLTTMWFSFVSFLIYGYTANLVSILMNRPPPNPVVPYKSVKQMFLEGDPSVSSTFSTSQLKSLFMDSPKQDVMALYDVIARNGFVGYKSLEKNDKMALASLNQDEMKTILLPSSVVHYHIAGKCDIVPLERILPMPYAFCLNKVSGGQLLDKINEALLKIIEEGRLAQIMKKWMRSETCSRDMSQLLAQTQIPVITARPLSLADLFVAYILLAIGIVIAIVMLIVEKLLHKRRNKQEEPEPVLLTSTNGGAAKGEGGTDDEKAPMAADEP